MKAHLALKTSASAPEFNPFVEGARSALQYRLEQHVVPAECKNPVSHISLKTRGLRPDCRLSFPCELETMLYRTAKRLSANPPGRTS